MKRFTEKTLLEHAAELEHALTQLEQTAQVEALHGQVKEAIVFAANKQEDKALQIMFGIVGEVRELLDKMHK